MKRLIHRRLRKLDYQHWTFSFNVVMTNFGWLHTFADEADEKANKATTELSGASFILAIQLNIVIALHWNFFC